MSLQGHPQLHRASLYFCSLFSVSDVEVPRFHTATPVTAAHAWFGCVFVTHTPITYATSYSPRDFSVFIVRDDDFEAVFATRLRNLSWIRDMTPPSLTASSRLGDPRN